MTVKDDHEDLARKPYLTSVEAVAYLSLPSLKALHARVARGTVPAWTYSRIGRSFRFNRAALDELLNPPERQAFRRVRPPTLTRK